MSTLDMVIPCQATIIVKKGSEFFLKIVKKDIVGNTYGSLTVLDCYAQKGIAPNRKTYWLCECSCGHHIFVERTSLLKRRVGYCSECRPVGKRNTRLYHTYYSMIERCENKNNPNYPKYGAKGISVCDSWRISFDNFKNWAVDNGYDDSLTIDRIDSLKGYCPTNCRWITLSENSARANIGIVKNKSKLKNMYAVNETHGRIDITNIKSFCMEYGLNYSMVVSALHGRCKYKASGWMFFSNVNDNC